jgi:hypothetical protein
MATTTVRKSRVKSVLQWQLPDQVRPAVSVVSAVLLAVATGILIWSIWSAVTYSLSHPGPPCSNPPQREAFPPQWVVVGSCLLAFVLGHFTARSQLISQDHGWRHNVKDAEHPENDPRKRDALIIQALLLVFLLEVVGLLIIEAVTLARGVWPITYYVRCAYDAAGLQSMAAAASILFLVGRWFWLPARGEDARTRP